MLFIRGQKMSSNREGELAGVRNNWNHLAQFEKFVSFQGLEWERAMDSSIVIQKPKGTIFSRLEVQNMNMVFVILRGMLKVFSCSENGRVICLCHLKSGSICPISLGSVMGTEIVDASCLAESDVTLLGVPKSQFQALMESNPSFRDLIVAEMLRFSDSMVSLVNQVSFTKLPTRVARYLLYISENYSNDTIPYTHQAFANELGTTREVMSRLLKEFESHGYITMERKAIKISERAKLVKFAEQSV